MKSLEHLEENICCVFGDGKIGVAAGVLCDHPVVMLSHIGDSYNVGDTDIPSPKIKDNNNIVMAFSSVESVIVLEKALEFVKERLKSKTKQP